MRKDDLVFVRHMLDMALSARDKITGKDRAAYDNDETLRLALAYLIQTIGEAARQVAPEFRDTHPEIPWTKIVAIRHRIVHDYLHVDYDIVWDVVTTDLPPLIDQLNRITANP